MPRNLVNVYEDLGETVFDAKRGLTEENTQLGIIFLFRLYQIPNWQYVI